MFLVSQVVFFPEKEAKLQLLQPPERPFTSLVGGFGAFFGGEDVEFQGLLVGWEVPWEVGLELVEKCLEKWLFVCFFCLMLTKLGQNWLKEEVGTCGHVKHSMSKTRTVQRVQCLFMKCQNYFHHGICPMYVYPPIFSTPGTHTPSSSYIIIL